ncbi:MAG: FlgD immunoglobulin-like domain containing protein, partial [bacterium]
SYTLTLKPGWNQIGLPFAFPVAWDSIFIASDSPDSVEIPWLYEGGYDPADILEPYKGYFIRNKNDSNISLRIPPIALEGLSKSLARSNLSNSEWSLQIKATCQEARDEFNLLGINKLASDDWDPLDYTEPPPIGEYVSVYFPKQDWEIYPNNYTTDYRHNIGEGQSWIVNVKTNIRNSEVKINFAGLEAIPQDLEIILLDEKLHITKNLKSDQSYSFPTGNFGTTKTLKLSVGNSNFISDEISDNALIPTDFELSQNFPNPFNPVTSIRYGLPRSEKVTIRIFDLLGREVLTLIDGEKKEAGYHVISWNGRDNKGSPVASGLYIYYIISGKFSQSRKMLLIK